MKAMNKNMVNDLVDHANKKLRFITKDGYPVRFEDVRITADEDDGIITVMSGSNVVASGGFSDVKSAVWGVVDSTRKEVEVMTGFTAEATPAPEPVRRHDFTNRFDRPKREWLSDFDFLIKMVNETIDKANEELGEIVKNGYPFSIDDVVMTCVSDSAGLYVHSGNTPVISISRAKSDGTLRVIKSKIWDVVNATKATVERRISQKAEADELAAEDGKMSAAAAALKAAGLDTAILGMGVNLEAANAVAEAAKKAVKLANRGIYLSFSNVCDALYGGRDGALLRVKGYAGGLVVLAGDKPCLVTRFPKVANNATIERTISFVESDIRAIGESRRSYFAELQREMEREEWMHEKATTIDAANDALAAAM